MATFVDLSCTQCSKVFSRRLAIVEHNIRKGRNGQFCSLRCRGDNLKIPIPQGEDLAGAYLAGCSTAELGAKHGVCGETVNKWLRRLGVEIRKTGYWMTTDRNPTKGKGHSNAAKEKLREANKRQFSQPGARERHAELQRVAMAEGRIKKTSGVEDAVAGFLEELEIQYTRWAAIRDTVNGRFVACVDFLLDNKVVLEVQGDYWHANPEVYPGGPKYASQWKTVANDERKRLDLERLGYVVKYIWEKAIKRTGVAGVKAVLA